MSIKKIIFVFVATVCLCLYSCGQQRSGIAIVVKKYNLKSVTKQNIVLQALVEITNPSKRQIKYKLQKADIYYRNNKVGNVNPKQRFDVLPALQKQNILIDLQLNRDLFIAGFFKTEIEGKKHLIEVRGTVLAKVGLFTVEENFNFTQEVNVKDFIN